MVQFMLLLLFKENNGKTSFVEIMAHKSYYGAVINNYDKAFFVNCIFNRNTNDHVDASGLSVFHNYAGVLYAQRNSMTTFVNCSFYNETDNIHALPASNIVFYNDKNIYANGLYEDGSCVSVKSLSLWYNNYEDYNIGVFNCSNTSELYEALKLANNCNNYSIIVINLKPSVYSISKGNFKIYDDYHEKYPHFTYRIFDFQERYLFEVGCVPVTINGNGATIELNDAGDKDYFHFAFVSKYASFVVNDVVFKGFNTVIKNVGLNSLNRVTFTNNYHKARDGISGAVYNDGKMYCENCTFVGNSAYSSSYGNAIYCGNSSGTFLQIIGGKFANNGGTDILITGTTFLKLVGVNPVVNKKDNAIVYTSSSAIDVAIDVNVTSVPDLMAARNLVNSNNGAYDIIRIHFSPGSYEYFREDGSLFDVKYGSVFVDGAGASVYSILPKVF